MDNQSTACSVMVCIWCFEAGDGWMEVGCRTSDKMSLGLAPFLLLPMTLEALQALLCTPHIWTIPGLGSGGAGNGVIFRGAVTWSGHVLHLGNWRAIERQLLQEYQGKEVINAFKINNLAGNAQNILCKRMRMQQQNL
jgi:hypothetical protein